MKILRLIVLGIVIISLFHACDMGHRHTTIVENDNNHYMKIEFAGDIHFNREETRIVSISRGGYVKYICNDRKLEAKRNNLGGVKYELFVGDQRLNPNDNGKALIAEAVTQIIKKTGQHPDLR